MSQTLCQLMSPRPLRATGAPHSGKSLLAALSKTALASARTSAASGSSATSHHHDGSSAAEARHSGHSHGHSPSAGAAASAAVLPVTSPSTVREGVLHAEDSTLAVVEERPDEGLSTGGAAEPHAPPPQHHNHHHHHQQQQQQQQQTPLGKPPRTGLRLSKGWDLAAVAALAAVEREKAEAAAALASPIAAAAIVASKDGERSSAGDRSRVPSRKGSMTVGALGQDIGGDRDSMSRASDRSSPAGELPIVPLILEQRKSINKGPGSHTGPLPLAGLQVSAAQVALTMPADASGSAHPRSRRASSSGLPCLEAQGLQQQAQQHQQHSGASLMSLVKATKAFAHLRHKPPAIEVNTNSMVAAQASAFAADALGPLATETPGAATSKDPSRGLQASFVREGSSDMATTTPMKNAMSHYLFRSKSKMRRIIKQEYTWEGAKRVAKVGRWHRMGWGGGQRACHDGAAPNRRSAATTGAHPASACFSCRGLIPPSAHACLVCSTFSGTCLRRMTLCACCGTCSSWPLSSTWW